MKYIFNSLCLLVALFSLSPIAIAQNQGLCASNCELFGDSCCEQPNGTYACAQIRVDHSNCGACGVSCSFYEFCFAGQCTCEDENGFPDICESHETCMGKGVGCRDLQTDPDYCGNDPVTCSPGEICVGGVCTQNPCPEPVTLCDGSCTDISSDEEHCGGCNNSCPSGTRCESGACAPSCPQGQLLCNGSCVDVSTNESFCGNCSTRCAASEKCVVLPGSDTPTCRSVCPAGLSTCTDGLCKDLDIDNQNCGVCGNTCPPGTRCNGNGQCEATCTVGYTNCGGSCVDLSQDSNNCGSCGNACIPGQRCNGAGSCELTCSPGMTSCGGVCVNLDSNNNHCGACNVDCPLGTSCNGYGQCTLVCQPGKTRCGSECVDLDDDNENCGSCGIVCPSGTRCDGSGSCSRTCDEEQILCGNAGCINSQTDEMHCGTCGNECQSIEDCIEGECKLVNQAASSAATKLYIPFWSLKDAQSNLVVHAISGPANLLVRFYDTTGNEHSVHPLSLETDSTKTLDLSDPAFLLDDIGAGSVVIEPALRSNLDIEVTAETNVFDKKLKQTFVFQHTPVVNGVWTRFSKNQQAPIAILSDYKALAFCPDNDLELKLLSLGELPARPTYGFSSQIDVIIRNADGQQLAAPRITCDSVTFINVSDFFIGKSGKVVTDLAIEGSVELSTPRIFSSVTGLRIPEDSRMIGYTLNSPMVHKEKQRSKTKYPTGTYMNSK